jgi:hypothetical protein
MATAGGCALTVGSEQAAYQIPDRGRRSGRTRPGRRLRTTLTRDAGAPWAGASELVPVRAAAARFTMPSSSRRQTGIVKSPRPSNLLAARVVVQPYGFWHRPWVRAGATAVGLMLGVLAASWLRRMRKGRAARTRR